MNKTKLLCIALGMITMTTSIAGFAGNRAGAGYVSLGDGAIFFASSRYLKNTSTPTIRLGYDFTDHWAAQASVSLINTDQKGSGVHSHVHGFDYSIDGVYRTDTYQHFEPYIFAGLGMMSLNTHGTDPVDKANAEMGIGSQYFISDSIAFGLDVKDIYTFSGGNNDVQLTATINFLFGGNTTPQQNINWKGMTS